MKVVINRCFGGFSLSPRAVQRLAELQERPCYFYRNVRNGATVDFKRYERITLEQTASGDTFMWYAFDVPDAETTILARYTNEEWRAATDEQREAWSMEYRSHQIDSRRYVRDDPLLVQVVEELGGEHHKGASGTYAKLCIVEIPDGTDYTVEEYDGMEHIAEVHRTWSCSGDPDSRTQDVATAQDQAFDEAGAREVRDIVQ